MNQKNDLDGAGDDQDMAQADRSGYSTDVQNVTSGKMADVMEGGTQEIGNPQPLDSGAPIPKV